MMKGLRILIVTSLFPPDIGGPATYVRDMSLDLVKRGHTVRVITTGEKTEESHPFPVDKVSAKWPFFLRILWFTLKMLQHSSYDVIYLISLFNAGIAGMLVKQFANIPMLIKVTGDDAWERARVKGNTQSEIEEFQTHVYGFKTELFKGIQKITVRTVDHVIVPSKFLRNIVTGWGVSSNKIAVIYNATRSDDRSLCLSKNEAREKIGINGIIILTVARLVNWKGIDKLIKIIPKLSKHVGSDVKLIIVGDGPEKERLEWLAERTGVENSVIFTGRVQHSEIPVYLRAADVFVLFSSYEGFPHILLEAMQAGTPIVASKACGNMELIDNGSDGFLVPLDNTGELTKAICRVVKDKEIKKGFMNRSRDKVKQFNWDDMVNKTIRVLESVSKRA